MKPSFASTRLYLSIAICFLASRVESGALPLTNSNFDTILATHELVFINFYADWCRFSNMLAPIFDDAADKLAMELPEGGKAIMAKVDCDSETSIASRFHITKYPTLKMIRNGQVAKKEYRGQRSTQAFVDYIKEQLADPIKEYKSVSELNNLDDKKRTIIGYFEQKGTPEYENFRKVASNLKDDCSFYAGFGDASRAMHPPGQDIVAFRPAKARSNENDETFTGNMKTFDELSIWITEKCLPLVREITFENAEELTEEGLPFLILFYDPDDLSSIKTYNDIINKELLDEKQNINFLTADGSTFAHPLQHLGKSKKDLPLIAIDSFRHMYLFPDYQDIHKSGKLKQFLADLHSGKLHREFHYGPDPVSETAHAIEHKPHGAVPANQVNLTPQGQEQGGTSPPESTFKKLAPSKNRYTLLNPRDEL